MTKCPKCDLQWEPPCDQTACIELFGECISCRRFKLTEDEIKQIQTSAALERKAENARELGLDYYVPCCTDQTCPKCKSALEAKDEPVVWNEGVPAMLPKQKEGETFIVSYEPKQEAKDEPVAWRDAAIRLGEELSSVGPDGYYDMDAKEWLDWAMEQNPRGKHSLPQRTWAGLTYDEIDELSRTMVVGERSVNWLCYAIETKLKQKNFKE